MTAAHVSLPDVLDIAVVSSLALEIRKAVTNDAIVIDAGAVMRADAAGLQLLCAAVIAARSRGTSVQWRSPGRNLCDAARSLGVDALLGLESASR
jgi:anti-anti-sigma regulatory factor